MGREESQLRFDTTSRCRNNNRDVVVMGAMESHPEFPGGFVANGIQ